MDWVKKAPAALADDDVRAYFLYLRETKKLAPSSINVAVYAMRFFFIHTMNREWKVFEVLRVHKQRLLPVVLSPAEVRTLLGAVRDPIRRMALTTIYALGLRLGEGRSLETGHIDSQRMLVWVRDGKGAKDRAVDVYAIADRLEDAGWSADRQQHPATVHHTVTSNHLPVIDEYIDDLRDAVAFVLVRGCLQITRQKAGDPGSYCLHATPRAPLIILNPGTYTIVAERSAFGLRGTRRRR